MGRLGGKISIVPDGSSGIGLATAKRFVADGVPVFITGRRKAELDAAASDLGRNVTAVKTGPFRAARYCPHAGCDVHDRFQYARRLPWDQPGGTAAPPAPARGFSVPTSATIMDGRIEASGCNRRTADGTWPRGDRPVGRPSPRYRSWAVSTISTVSDLSARRRPRTRLLPDQRMGFLRRTGGPTLT